MTTFDALKKAVDALKGPMEFHPRQVIISEEVLNMIMSDIHGQRREIEKLKSKLAISKSIARHYRKDAPGLLKEQEAVTPYIDIDEAKCPICKVKLTRQELLGDDVLFEDFYDYCPHCGRKVKWE